MIQFAVEKANRVLVITHIDPDGDAIGSLTAVGQAMEQLGKRVTLVCDDAVPPRFLSLPLAGDIRRASNADATYDLVVAVDCADELRMGWAYDRLKEPKPTLANIDHHITNTRFGAFNIIDPDASSTAELLHRFLPEIGVEMTPGIAESLLTGIVTDTMGFRTSNVTATTLRAAADLVDAGADIAAISLEALHQRPYATAQIWAIGLDDMKMEDGLIWSSISRQDLQSAGLERASSSSGLVNFLLDIDTAVMAAVLTEMADDTVRVTMRCQSPYNVADVARQFGGGGHALAAGCALDGPLEDAEARIIAACHEAIRRVQSPSTP
ncbi:MAG: DHH family phosphoesterase [Anaerolineae bacterium]|nr:DHH family phosphoesterase [Anaerolineae bacterium]